MAWVSSTGVVTVVGKLGDSAVITAQSEDGVCKQTCIVNVYSSDPYHPTNIEYIRCTKITSSNTAHLLSVVKSRLYTDDIFIVQNQKNGVLKNYFISNNLKDDLNTLESGYHDHYSIIPLFNTTTDEECAAHAAKGETDQLVSAGYIINNSSEYYGAWANNYEEELSILGHWNSVFNMAMAAYGVYLSISSLYYADLANGESTIVSSSEYSITYSYADDIENALSDLSYNNRTVITAQERNQTLLTYNYTDAPYLQGSPVMGFKPTQSTGTLFVKVSSSETITSGGFVMRYNDIQGLSAEQIQSKFALNYVPTHYGFVNIPAGNQIYVGVVGSNYGMPGGGIQFDIVGNWANINYPNTSTYPIP